MTANNIQLNGIKYTSENLDDLHVKDEPDDSWRNAIYHFLVNWFDESDFILAQTSGSTGKPKEIHLRKAAMINSARMTNHFFKLHAKSTALLCMPASYIAGKMMLVRAIVGGFNLLTVEPSANPFKNLNVPIDFTAITPYQLSHSIESLLTKHVGKIIVGGSPVTGKLEQLVENIPAELYETYGMTETCSHIALRRFNGKDKSDCFTVLSGIEIHQTKRGTLVIDAPLLLEYEIHTNDLVELVGENSFRWLGRDDMAINSGGLKIHPEQIEKKLESVIPSAYFITALPDFYLLYQVVLVIESGKYSPEQEQNLRNSLKEVLGKYEIPKQIFYLPSFIYSSGNKVLRRETMNEVMRLGELDNK